MNQIQLEVPVFSATFLSVQLVIHIIDVNLAKLVLKLTLLKIDVMSVLLLTVPPVIQLMFALPMLLVQ